VITFLLVSFSIALHLGITGVVYGYMMAGKGPWKDGDVYARSDKEAAEARAAVGGFFWPITLAIVVVAAGLRQANRFGAWIAAPKLPKAPKPESPPVAELPPAKPAKRAATDVLLEHRLKRIEQKVGIQDEYRQ
jgi:hypothetical protein